MHGEEPRPRAGAPAPVCVLHGWASWGTSNSPSSLLQHQVVYVLTKMVKTEVGARVDSLLVINQPERRYTVAASSTPYSTPISYQTHMVGLVMKSLRRSVKEQEEVLQTLQPVVQPKVRQLCPCSPWRTTGEQSSTCSLWRRPMP